MLPDLPASMTFGLCFAFPGFGLVQGMFCIHAEEGCRRRDGETDLTMSLGLWGSWEVQDNNKTPNSETSILSHHQPLAGCVLDFGYSHSLFLIADCIQKLLNKLN